MLNGWTAAQVTAVFCGVGCLAVWPGKGEGFGL
jgi:hypothetical protein